MRVYMEHDRKCIDVPGSCVGLWNGKKKEMVGTGEKGQRRDTYYLGQCVQASHKPLCFIRTWPNVHGSVLRSLISLGKKYRGRFCKNRRRSGFQ